MLSNNLVLKLHILETKKYVTEGISRVSWNAGSGTQLRRRLHEKAQGLRRHRDTRGDYTGVPQAGPRTRVASSRTLPLSLPPGLFLAVAQVLGITLK